MKNHYKSKLPQDKNYIEYCEKIPDEFKITLNLDENQNTWSDNVNTDNIVNTDNNADNVINADVWIKDGIEMPNVQDCILLAAGAYSGKTIKHILDGYSTSIITRIGMDADDKLTLTIHCLPVESDKILYNQEKNGSRLKAGLFTSDMPLWKKLLLGNLFKFLCGGLAIERSTAHQPIYYPQEKTILYCSINKYHSLSYNDKPNNFSVKPCGWAPKFSPKKYFCMHPHYDQIGKKMLTYTFTHAILTRTTHITFYEYGDDSENPLLTEYKINDRSALHMFGFTKHYYVLFANPLHLEKHGQTKIVFGKAILRTLNDNYTSNLIIHFIPRPEFTDLKPFSVDTNLPGFVYHTINCFENDNKTIVVDAFVSDLNASREAAQFELDSSRQVFDNNGDPHRFLIKIPDNTEPDNNMGDPCKFKLSASVVDSTIDFHCINHDYVGVEHHFTWIVGHERIRDENGNVSQVVSSLYKIELPKPNLDFNGVETVKYSVKSTDWDENSSVYFRTPLFVPKKGSIEEDDGYIFMWSYKGLRSKLMIFSAKDLDLLVQVNVPKEYHIPYSVHSWIYPYLNKTVLKKHNK